MKSTISKLMVVGALMVGSTVLAAEPAMKPAAKTEPAAKAPAKPAPEAPKAPPAAHHAGKGGKHHKG